VPVKPLAAVTLIVELVREPASATKLVGLAAIVKSTTWNVTVAIRVSEPLVPVTVTLLFPALGYVQLKVTELDVIVGVRVTLGALRVHVLPAF